MGIDEPCPDCNAQPGEPCTYACSSHWTDHDSAYPVIEDSFIGKRAQPAVVSEDDNIGVAV